MGGGGHSHICSAYVCAAVLKYPPPPPLFPAVPKAREGDIEI